MGDFLKYVFISSENSKIFYFYPDIEVKKDWRSVFVVASLILMKIP